MKIKGRGRALTKIYGRKYPVRHPVNIHTYERRRKGLYSNSSIRVDGTVGLSSSSLACRRNNRQATQPKHCFSYVCVQRLGLLTFYIFVCCQQVPLKHSGEKQVVLLFSVQPFSFRKYSENSNGFLFS